MHITPDMVEAAYSYLCTTLPFRRWKMPHPDRIQFRVMVTRERFGHWFAYINSDVVGELAVSTLISGSNQLISTVAHEMTHMRQEQLGYRDRHGKHFKRLGKVVCRRHGWDLRDF